LGADLAVNYQKEDFVEAVSRMTAGRGVDVVLDMVGGDYVPRNLSVLAPQGRHVSIAVQKGRLVTVDMVQVMQKRLVLTGSTIRSRSKEEKALLVGEVEEKIWSWIVSGEIKPLIYKVFPIKQAVEAHKMMESSAHIGKIVLEVAS
ncbi:MAG: zinc-binding dehydrogenase, partial [Alphaproteobacteria bacterium]|nr:zinc-binding dehydrogenase [Alphaproteobacteria bacterium]